MWEKLNKVKVQVIVAVIVIVACFGFLFLLAMLPVPKGNEKLIDILGGIIIGSTLTPVLGWLYTISKSSTDKPHQP